MLGLQTQEQPSPLTCDVVDAEMNVAEALTHFHRVIDDIGKQHDPREIKVSAVLLKHLAAFMHDYRRHIEISYGSLPLMHFTSAQERRRALDAYQGVCQRAALVIQLVESAVE